jgi:glutamine amidotransferase
MKSNVVILDTGISNSHSIRYAFNEIGFKVSFSDDLSHITSEDLLVIPGVGSFETAMTLMKKNKLDTKIKNLISNGQKVLGICLGMQLLFSFSEEGNSNGLDIFKGKVVHLKNLEVKKYPNIGWNKTNFSNKKMGIEDEYFYYVHNYTVIPENSSIIFANTYIEDKLLVTAVRGTDDKKNILGIQFHPEKSGKNGLNFLKIITSKILNSE